MGMNLQAELEPLLTKLWQAADTMYMGQADDDPTNPGLVREAEEGRTSLHGDLNTLCTRFRGYYTLDGHDLDPYADVFAGQSDSLETPTGSSVYCSIGRAAGDVDNVGKLIHYDLWTGKAAQRFHDNFVDPFRKTALVHAATARDLAIGAKAVARAIEHAKECVVWICKDAVSRLGGGPPPGAMPGREGSDYHEQAAFIAILADTVALFKALAAPELELVDVTLAAIGATGGVVAEWKSEGGEHEAPISVAFSESAAVIVYNTSIALDNLDRNISEFDKKAAEGIDADLDPSGPLGSPYATIQNPHLDSSAYSQLTFRGPEHPKSDAEDGVITSIVRLYAAGFRTLPAAAGQYEFGARTCAGAQIDAARKQFPLASKSFNTLAGRLGRLMEGVRDDLTDSGKAIVRAANDYHATDAHEAAAIKKLTGEIPSPDNFQANSNWEPPAWLTP